MTRLACGFGALFLFLFLVGCQVVEEGPAPEPGDLTTHGRQLSLGAGARRFSDDDFTELDDQAAFALDYCEPMELGALRLEGGLLYAGDDSQGTFQGQDVDLSSEVFEPSVGFQYSLRFGRLRPFLGAGLALQFLDVHGIDSEGNQEFEDDDVVFGTYWKGGLLFQVTPTSHVGIEFRHLVGDDVRLDGASLDTSYDQVLVLFGTSFRGS